MAVSKSPPSAGLGPGGPVAPCELGGAVAGKRAVFFTSTARSDMLDRCGGFEVNLLSRQLSAARPPVQRRVGFTMRILAFTGVGLVAAAACSQPAKPKAAGSPTPTVNLGSSPAAWKACGSDVVPPTSVLATPKLPVKVDASKTNGSVSQAEADKWAEAYLREQNVENWALTTNHDILFSSGCLGAQ